MNILDQIIARKRVEVAERKALVSTSQLEALPAFSRDRLSMKRFLLDDSRTGIIAEFKRRSPSKGIINATATVEEVTAAYAAHGASGISVLTDADFFGGSLNDLLAAGFNEVPLLRKDFMVDEYQLVEARAYGASAILLIAACLSPQEVRRLSAAAHHLGLEVLLELHGPEELDHICDTVDLVGVNNRNLKTFEVNLEASIQLIQNLPASLPAVAESGIGDVETIVSLKRSGFRGFLIGEHFMRQADPAVAFAAFTQQLKRLS